MRTLLPQPLHEQVAVLLPVVPLMTTRCGEVLVGVAVAGEVVVVGYHAGVEEVGLAYHHPIELGGIGKLCLVLALQSAVEGGMAYRGGRLCHRGDEEGL